MKNARDVGGPAHAISRRSMVSWKLLTAMMDSGWEFIQSDTTSQKHCAPHSPAAKERKAYALKSKKSIGHSYLVALLTADARPSATVPHFRSDKFYEALIAGRPVDVKKRKRKFGLMKSFPEWEWPQDADDKAQSGGVKKRLHCKREHQDDEDLPSPRSSASAKSSSSSSSSSTSSTSSSDGADGSSAAAGATDAAPAASLASGGEGGGGGEKQIDYGRDMDAGEEWGIFRLRLLIGLYKSGSNIESKNIFQ